MVFYAHFIMYYQIDISKKKMKLPHPRLPHLSDAWFNWTKAKELVKATTACPDLCEHVFSLQCIYPKLNAILEE